MCTHSCEDTNNTSGLYACGKDRGKSAWKCALWELTHPEVYTQQWTHKYTCGMPLF